MHYLRQPEKTLADGKYSHYLVQIMKRGSAGNLTYVVKKILASGKVDKSKIFEYSSGDVIFQNGDFLKAIKLAFKLETEAQAKTLLPYIEISSLAKFDDLQLLNKEQ